MTFLLPPLANLPLADQLGISEQALIWEEGVGTDWQSATGVAAPAVLP